MDELKLLSGPSSDPNDTREMGMFDGKGLKLKLNGRFGPYLTWGKVNAGIPAELHEDLDHLPSDLAWNLVLDKMKKAGLTPATAGGSTGAKAKAGKQSAGKAKVAEVVKKPRAKSAWSLFCSEERPLLTAQGVKLGEASKILAARWKALEEAEPERFTHFAQLAMEDKARVEKEFQEGGGGRGSKLSGKAKGKSSTKGKAGSDKPKPKRAPR